MDLTERDISAMLRSMARAVSGEGAPADALLTALAQLVSASMVVDAELLRSAGGAPAVGTAHVWGLRRGQVVRIPRDVALPDRGASVLISRLAPLGRWLQAIVSASPPQEPGPRHPIAPPPTALRLGHCVASILEPSGNRSFRLLAAFRDASTPPFDRRDERIVHLLQDPLARLRSAETSRPATTVEASTASTDDRLIDHTFSDLPPYLQRISSALLTGAGEKQIAARLGFTYNTVHQYIKVIYRRLGVNSRAEFMARAQADALRRQVRQTGEDRLATGLAAQAPAAIMPDCTPSTHLPNQGS